MKNMNKLDRCKIVEMYSGSHAYGTAIPTSDVDIRGIFVADPISVRTPFFSIDEIELPDSDTKFYELNKFVQLLVGQNPNIIELVWVNSQHVIASSPAYEMLRQSRTRFLTSKIGVTTAGYALSQLKRIKGHNKWITNPQPEREPEQLDYASVIYNFSGNKAWNKTVPFDGFSAIDLGDNHYALYSDKGTWKDKRGNVIIKERDHIETLPRGLFAQLFTKKHTPDLIVKVNMKHFSDAHENWANYWEWKRNRNKTRSALEEQFGFDTKHAMHLVRLLRMGVEALSDGVIRVHRPDAQELLSIRSGAWTYDQVIEYADDMNDKVQHLIKTTNLPKEVDLIFAAKLILDIQDMHWNGGKQYI